MASECPCCNEPWRSTLAPFGPGLTLVECGDCTDSENSRCWEVAFAGVTDDGCTCSSVNGTHVLVAGTDCAFTPDGFERCVSGKSGGTGPCGTLCIQLFYGQEALGTCSGGDEWYIIVGDASLTNKRAIYEFSGGTYDCKGSNIFSLCRKDTSCATWPSSVTATAVECV